MDNELENMLLNFLATYGLEGLQVC